MTDQGTHKPLVMHIPSRELLDASLRRIAVLANQGSGNYKHALILPTTADVSGHELGSVDIHTDPAARPHLGFGGSKSMSRVFKTLDLHPDLVVTHGSQALAAAPEKIGLKRVGHVHVVEQSPKAESLSWLERRYQRGAARGATCALALTHVDPQSAARRLALHEPPVKVRDGIDLDWAQNASEQEITDAALSPFGLKRSDVIILTHSPLTPDWDIGTLVEAFSYLDRKHADAHLVIMGDGPALPSLTMLAERTGLGARIHFMSEAHADLMYSAAEIFAVSAIQSITLDKVYRAMASGLAIAGTKACDLTRVVTQGNAHYVTAQNAESLAAMLHPLLSAQKLRDQLGRSNALRASHEYGLSQTLETWEEVLALALRRKRGSI